MSTDQLTKKRPTPEDLNRTHRRRLLQLLAARDRLVQLMERLDLPDDERLECLRVLTLVETEMEHHFPGAFADKLPEWLLREAAPGARVAPDCPICRGDPRRMQHHLG